MKSNLKRVDFVNKTLIPDKQEGNVASLDEGYFRLATSIGNLKPRLKMSGHEHQVFDAVIMCTFGWNKSEDKVTNTYLAEMTELDDSDINKALNKLATRRIINLRKSGGFKVISVNKNLNDWVLNRTKKQNIKSPKKLGEITHKDGCFNRSSWGGSPNTKDSLTKDNNINNLTSENSNESPDSANKQLPSIRLEAAVSTPKGDKWGNADDLKAAEWIYKQVLKICPSLKKPNWASWANDVRLMRQIDKHDHKEICKMFSWANAHPFWKSNILCPAKLREKWTNLEAKINSTSSVNSASNRPQLNYDNTDWAEGLQI